MKQINPLSCKCEVKKRMIDKSFKWLEKNCSNVFNGDEIRCLYCNGAVRLHQQSKTIGIQDHVEHLSKQDSLNCKAGIYFRNENKKETEHKMSKNPIL